MSVFDSLCNHIHIVRSLLGYVVSSILYFHVTSRRRRLRRSYVRASIRST